MKPSAPPITTRQHRNGPSDVLDHATSEIASGSKLGIDATKKIRARFKRPWPPLIKMDSAVKVKVETLFSGG